MQMQHTFEAPNKNVLDPPAYYHSQIRIFTVRILTAKDAKFKKKKKKKKNEDSNCTSEPNLFRGNNEKEMPILAV